MQTNEKFGESKSIILACPLDVAMHTEIHKNLSYYGFEVIDLSKDFSKYSNLISHLKVKLKKFFDKNAKEKYQKQRALKYMQEKLKAYDKVDYVFCILAHRYDEKILDFLKSKCKNTLINYQYDGLERYPKIFDYITKFDRFFIFNPSDKKYMQSYPNILPTTNFFFDYKSENSQIKFDLYFIGKDNDSRKNLIIKFAKYIKQQALSSNLIICANTAKNLQKLIQSYDCENIKFITQTISYEQNLKFAKEAKVLVDFVIDAHKGLSFRTFEALGFDKKLITTNKTIKFYDFYHPNNIFILDNNFDEINDFLQKPYIINEKMKQKYSFGNWIRYILDIKPHEQINLANINF
ncbi:MAG: hypothetical protein K5978_03540 [Campylobacter sp.]|nr:hypothetical protein [Campylobacter sp.]